ncbi:uncharacterized protein RAG0_03182 [Rhynchosporium agropyri]|uniref:Uncharacterized protein n=1 Tax=Rhynchosporium agropyri TaxID=914238 RepID=A0A1E1K3I5_9HELO|nr:uncharacterized protein RAG0_03182 [Rhynchosporium agropyri]
MAPKASIMTPLKAEPTSLHPAISTSPKVKTEPSSTSNLVAASLAMSVKTEPTFFKPIDPAIFAPAISSSVKVKTEPSSSSNLIAVSLAISIKIENKSTSSLDNRLFVSQSAEASEVAGSVAGLVQSVAEVQVKKKFVLSTSDIDKIILSLPSLTAVVNLQALVIGFEQPDTVIRAAIQAAVVEPRRDISEYVSDNNRVFKGKPMSKEQVIQLFTWAGIAIRTLGRELSSKESIRDYHALTDTFNRYYEPIHVAKHGPDSYLAKGYNDINSAFIKRAIWPEFVKKVLGN